jgi:hypothetical protein
MKSITTTLILLLLFPVLAFAQLKQDAQVDMAKALTQPTTKIQGLVGLLGLDPAKFSMSQSYSLSFVTGGGHTYNQGLYLNTMRYQFSNPLSMYLQLGFVHQPFGNLGEENLKQGSDVFVSGAGLEYKPSENFKLQLEFSQQPRSYYPYYPYRSYHRFYNRTVEPLPQDESKQ